MTGWPPEIYALQEGHKGGTKDFLSHRNLLNLIKGKLVVRSIVELRRARGFASGNLLGRLKRSVVFKEDRNSSGPE